MDYQAHCIFIQAMIVNAQAELQGMIAHNQHVEACGNNDYYTEEAFNQIPEKYGITHNQVIEYLGSDPIYK